MLDLLCGQLFLFAKKVYAIKEGEVHVINSCYKLLDPQKLHHSTTGLLFTIWILEQSGIGIPTEH